MGTSHLPAQHTGWLTQVRQAIPVILYQGNRYNVEQIAYETDDFVVYELQDTITLNGKAETFLAIDQQAKLVTIDVLAGPRGLLAKEHGTAWMEWS